MKILQVANGDFFSTFGGGQVYVKNLVDEMINQGLDVLVFSFLNKKESTPKIDIKRYRKIPVYEIAALDETLIKDLIQQIAPSIIHAHAQKCFISKVAKDLSIPCIITAHHGGIVCPAGALMNHKDEIMTVPVSQEESLGAVLKNTKGGFFFYPLLKKIPVSVRLKLGYLLDKLPFIYFITPIGQASLSIEKKLEEWRQLIENTDLMIAPSLAISDSMVLNGLKKEKIRLLPHGIPIESSPQDIVPVNITDRRVSFFYIGRLCHIKGIHILLEAFIRLPESKCELHLIGDTDGSYPQKLIKRYKKYKHIFFHGKINPKEVLNTIKKFDILIHPTICLEVFGLNIAEALSEGKPVIATRCGGAEMQITDGENGLLVKPNDVTQLNDAMQWMIDHPAEVYKMSIHAPDNVVPMDKHVMEIIKIYEELIQTKYGQIL